MNKLSLLFTLLFLNKLIAQSTFIPNYDEHKIVSYILPDPGAVVGKKISTTSEWEKAKKKWLNLYASEMYGIFPKKKISITSTLISSKSVLNGQATMNLWEVLLGEKVKVQFIGFIPTHGSIKATLLGLNFCGNSTVFPDSSIPLTSKYVICNESPAYVNHKATTEAVGVGKESWQIEKVIQAGIASFSVHCGDFEEDFPDGYKNGVRTLLAKDLGLEAENWSAMSAWAWGLSNMVDVIKSLPNLKESKIILHGHSRMGKSSLWAAANDPRFDAVIAIQSGEGGAALLRRNFGEGISPITTRFPHWFLPNFAKYANNESTLPFDQHILLSTIAPRPLFVSSALDDKWADPKGEFLSAKNTQFIYQLYGKKGILEENMPPTEQLVGNTVSYYIRKGNHAVTSLDWDFYLTFIEKEILGSF